MVARGQLIPVDRTVPLDDRAVLMIAGSNRDDSGWQEVA
jgi:hypothetical protein